MPAHLVEIICLANSYKERGRCVAGIRTDGRGWIRPVAATSQGQLNREHYRFEDGGETLVLDVIRIGLEGHEPTPSQGENWRIADLPWKLIYRPLPQRFMRVLRESLWDGPNLFGDGSHRIRVNELESQSLSSSLALVKPKGLQWFIERKQFNSKKPRALFTLGGINYDLPVTDPAWVDAFRQLNLGLHPEHACGLRADEKLLLTISLSAAWDDGYCYKLVAGLVPIPKAWM